MNLIVLLFDFPSLGPVSRPDESKLQSLKFICLIASQSKYLAFLSQIFSHFAASEPALSVIFKSLKKTLRFLFSLEAEYEGLPLLRLSNLILSS